MFIMQCFIWSSFQRFFGLKPQTVTVQFVIFEGVFFCVCPCLSQCYWYWLFSLCLFLYLLPAVSFFLQVYTRLGSEICQSWPQKSNISTAVGCIHKTQPYRQHLNGRDISPIYYPSWPKLFLSFTVRVRQHFQLPKTLCWPSRASARWEKM